MNRLTRYIQLAACVLAAVLSIEAREGDAGQRYAIVGMVLKTDPAARTFIASIEKVPGFMEAMTMPFEVRDATELASLAPGAIVEFTLVVDGGRPGRKAFASAVTKVSSRTRKPPGGYRC